MLYTCARTIAKIKKFIKDRPAYISPGLVGNFDIKLSSVRQPPPPLHPFLLLHLINDIPLLKILNIPICCPFEIIPKFYSSAICRREMMVSSNVRSAPGTNGCRLLIDFGDLKSSSSLYRCMYFSSGYG